MRVTQELLARNSEDSFARRLQILSDSGASVIHVRTHEIVRATLALRKAILVDRNNLQEWDVVNGFRTFDVQNMFNFDVAGDNNIDFGNALQAPMEFHKQGTADADMMYYYVFVNPQYWLENAPVNTHLLLQAAYLLPSSNIRVVLLTPDVSLPEALSDSVVTLRFEPPGHGELKESLASILSGVDDDLLDVTEEDHDKICFAGAGLSKEAFEMYASLSIVDTAAESQDAVVDTDDFITGISKGKTEIINKNDLLELYPAEEMDQVGGMENLKEWVGKRKNCFTEEAADFGIEPPKGVVFVGPPGTGKSLAAKAVASEFGVPLIRLDFGRVFNSFVGKSEERIRTALRMVESMAPCVLFCDEVDKGLGGIGGSGDSGTSQRVLGTYLTWLNDTNAPVFNMVTANNIAGLPPELLRRGRFDGIFATGLPEAEEREQVLRIHLAKRGRELTDFPKRQIAEVITASNGYVPAEIESAVKDGLVNAFDAGEDFTMTHVADALKVMVPLSKSYKLEILAMVAWAQSNAMPAGKYTQFSKRQLSVVDNEPKTRVRVRGRRPRDDDQGEE